ncbi:MAG: hypothetical protein AAGH15_10600 [Myxococcota bacterium]
MKDVPFSLVFGDAAPPPFGGEDFMAPNQLRDVWRLDAAILGYASPFGPALARFPSPRALRPTEARHLAAGVGGWPRVVGGIRHGAAKRHAMLFAAPEGLTLETDGARRVLLEDARPGALANVNGEPWALAVRTDGLWLCRPEADPLRLSVRSDVRDVALLPLGEGGLAVYALADAGLGHVHVSPRGRSEGGRLQLSEAASALTAASAGRHVALAYAHGDERLGAALLGADGTVYERAHVLRRVRGHRVRDVAIAWVERAFVAAALTGAPGGDDRFAFASLKDGVPSPADWHLPAGPWRLGYAGRRWIAARVRAGERGEAAVRFAVRHADGTEDDAEHAFVPDDQPALLRQREVRELTYAVARRVQGPRGVQGGYRDGPGPLRPGEETLLRFPRGRPVHLRADVEGAAVIVTLSTRPGAIPAKATSAWRALLALDFRERREAFGFVRALLAELEEGPPPEALVGAWRDAEGTVAVLSLTATPHPATVAAWARAVASADEG